MIVRSQVAWTHTIFIGRKTLNTFVDFIARKHTHTNEWKKNNKNQNKNNDHSRSLRIEHFRMRNRDFPISVHCKFMHYILNTWSLMRVCNLHKQKECNIYECSDRIFMCTKTIEEMRERERDALKWNKKWAKMLANDVIAVIESVNHFISVLDKRKMPQERRTGENTILIKM